MPRSNALNDLVENESILHDWKSRDPKYRESSYHPIMNSPQIGFLSAQTGIRKCLPLEIIECLMSIYLSVYMCLCVVYGCHCLSVCLSAQL